MASEVQRPAVYVVATPIGNLEDITLRAARLLAEVDVIAAEDTRHTRKLLNHLGIQSAKLWAYHDHGESERAAALISKIVADSMALALVSDAGTPGIADPGYRLVREAHAAGVPVHPLPGPSALTALISASGLASDRVMFVGFLPAKSKARQDEIHSWSQRASSVVFFEAMRRLPATLAAIAQAYPESRVAIGRELTKMHEEVVNFPIGGSAEWIASKSDLRGEASVMLELGHRSEGVSPGEEDQKEEVSLREQVRLAFAQGASLKDLLRLHKDCGLPRSQLYDLLLEEKSGSRQS